MAAIRSPRSGGSRSSTAVLVGARHGARRPGIEDASEVAVRLKVVSLCGELVCLVAVSDLSEMIEIHNMCQRTAHAVAFYCAAKQGVPSACPCVPVM